MQAPRKLLLAGEPAMRAAAEVLKTAHPVGPVNSVMGPVMLVPGTIWAGNRMLISAGQSQCISTEDDRLYEWNTGLFIQEEWMQAQQRAAKSAEGWVVIAQIEMALLTAIIAPMWLLLAMHAAKAGLFYAANQQAFSLAIRHGGDVYKLLSAWKTKYPTLWRKLLSKAGNTVWNEIKHENVSLLKAEDVAYFIGRLLNGLGAAPEITLGVVVKVLGVGGGLGLASMAVKIGVRAIPSSVVRPAEQHAKELQNYLSSIGYMVSPDEAKQIIKEIMADSDAASNMQKLELALRALLPSLNTLHAAYKRGM
jgi:hypothetical protein